MTDNDGDTIDCSARVPENLHQARLDQAAAALFPDFSRSRLQAWIAEGALTIDGRSARSKDKVLVGQALILQTDKRPVVDWSGQDGELVIVFEDEHVIVVDKPPGLVVHPAAGHADGTLVNRLIGYAPELERIPRGGIVHRLDKDTSGILVVARSTLAHQSLVAQLAERSVKREYLAICQGVPSGGATIDAPIGRHPTARTRMAVIGSGKAAVTHYRIRQRFAHYTALDVNLETGRTHQIRVHLAHQKHPLLGDPVYGGRPRPPKGASAELHAAVSAFTRQALHARTLGFDHPESGQRCQFEVEIPPDISTLLSVLGAWDPP